MFTTKWRLKNNIFPFEMYLATMFNSLRPSDALLQQMACRLTGAIFLTNADLLLFGNNSNGIWMKIWDF